MEIKIAEKGGFCWGVRRAMDITMETAQKEHNELYTYGPIIHNPQVIEMLESKNVKVVKDLDAVGDETLIIRTHGITPEKRKEIKDKGIRIKDATCPLVMRVQSIIKRYARKGYYTVIMGDPRHAEIIGLLGFAKEKGVVVSSIEDVEKLAKMDPVCVVSQTTLDKKKYLELGKKIWEKFPGCVMENTICDATDERQTEVMKLATEVNAMIVVGGRNSANTTHLAEISQSMGTPTFMVETESEIDPAKLINFKIIGVAAGASTPNWMIRRVVDKLEEIKLRKRNWVVRTFTGISRFLILSNSFVAIGAGFMTYAASRIMGIEPSLPLMMVSFLYFFSMYILNSFTDEEVIRFNDPKRGQFNIQYKHLLLAVGGVSVVMALMISFFNGMIPFLLLLSATALGFLYSVKVIPNIFSSPIEVLRIKDIPSSKDLFIALSWCVTTVLIPLFSTDHSKSGVYSIATALCFVYVLVYVRCLLYDVRDIQGDRMVGRETIPVLIGKEKTKILLFVLCAFLAVMLLASGILHWTSSISFFLLLSVFYACGYLLLYRKRVISTDLNYEIVVDGNFIFTGFIAYLWAMHH